MRERPILFSGAMVRAILADQKTQTRRVVKWPVHGPSDGAKRRVYSNPDDINEALAYTGRAFHSRLSSPYGRSGGRLWVRETWGRASDEFGCEHVVYRADGVSHMVGADARGEFLIRQGVQPTPVAPDRWRPSIHMPRWASRLTLDVTEARIERLHDISDEDAKAEGFEPVVFSTDGRGTEVSATARERFEATWCALYGEESWQANPWVWVVGFQRADGAAKEAA